MTETTYFKRKRNAFNYW